MKLEELFQPVKIGSLETANRIIMTAVTTRYDFEDSDRVSRFYAQRAKDGVGLITGAIPRIRDWQPERILMRLPRLDWATRWGHWRCRIWWALT